MAVKITIDKNSGFCFGVVHAIQMAEEELKKGEVLYCLGDIVHNSMEVERLNKLGLVIIDHATYKQLKDVKVLIRAHGEPPETYQIALRNNIELIDASCPVVLKLQNRIRIGYEASLKNQGQIVIFGKEGHAEVIGLEGQTKRQSIVIGSRKDLEKIDYSKPVYFYSQTTQSPEEFLELKDEIANRLKAKGQTFFDSNDTICRQVSNRAPQLRSFVKEFDVVIFVSGKKSSNGKYLYEICKSENANTYMVNNKESIETSWFEEVKNVGIAGATSTPMWLMEDIAQRIKEITD